jgi:hypothetical protein
VPVETFWPAQITARHRTQTRQPARQRALHGTQWTATKVARQDTADPMFDFFCARANPGQLIRHPILYVPYLGGVPTLGIVIDCAFDSPHPETRLAGF